MNRDLSKVVTIDTIPEHLSLQPENAIILPKWKGDAANKGGLVGLIPFLECTNSATPLPTSNTDVSFCPFVGLF